MKESYAVPCTAAPFYNGGQDADGMGLGITTCTCYFVQKRANSQHAGDAQQSSPATKPLAAKKTEGELETKPESKPNVQAAFENVGRPDGGFFSGLFGGDSSPAESKPAPKEAPDAKSKSLMEGLLESMQPEVKQVLTPKYSWRRCSQPAVLYP
jgi:hypothetical protein